MIINSILHLSQHIQLLVEMYGTYAYLLFFIIIFCETGLVIAPFLPGDSLLFACGSLAAAGALQLSIMLPLFVCAALLGDNCNYFIGRTLGQRLFAKRNSKMFKQKYLHKTHQFYEEFGGKTLIIARFVPIVRTFAPFVAGVARMAYRRFISFSFIAALVWVASVVLLGYAFGNIPVVKHNFVYVIFLIIVLSLLPPLFEWIKYRKLAAKNK